VVESNDPFWFLAFPLKGKWCGWGIFSPPGFQFPAKELVACMKDLMGELHKLSFFSIMVKIISKNENRI